MPGGPRRRVRCVVRSSWSSEPSSDWSPSRGRSRPRRPGPNSSPRSRLPRPGPCSPGGRSSPRKGAGGVTPFGIRRQNRPRPRPDRDREEPLRAGGGHVEPSPAHGREDAGGGNRAADPHGEGTLQADRLALHRPVLRRAGRSESWRRSSTPRRGASNATRSAAKAAASGRAWTSSSAPTRRSWWRRPCGTTALRWPRR